jgi:hypothetical protein
MITATPTVMSEVMKKIKQEQMKPKEFPPLKDSDHRSPTLRWSLFTFNIELKKDDLEVGG